MRKKTNPIKNNQNRKILRTSLLILAIAGFFIITSIIFFEYGDLFIKDLYRLFIFNFIGNILLHIGILFIFIYLLYSFLIITFKNPQKIKKSRVIKFAIAGVVVLCLCLVFIYYSISMTYKGSEDIKAYSNNEWIVRDHKITEIYRGTRLASIRFIKSALISTDDGDEFILYGNTYKVRVGELYRITYLNETKTIIDIQRITNK